MSCGRERVETDGEVWARSGMESKDAERERVSAEIRMEQREKRARRRVRKVA